MAADEIVANGDPPGHAGRWRTEQAAKPAPRPPLPPWCGTCGVDTGNHPDAVRNNPRLRYRDGRRCPDCHPDMIGPVT